jgi:hypothetical protein
MGSARLWCEPQAIPSDHKVRSDGIITLLTLWCEPQCLESSKRIIRFKDIKLRDMERAGKGEGVEKGVGGGKEFGGGMDVPVNPLPSSADPVVCSAVAFYTAEHREFGEHAHGSSDQLHA